MLKTTFVRSEATPRAAGFERATTRRVLAAALEVFAREGLAATTRQIAQTAGVNEVTLFRQFETKENLLAAVTLEMVRSQTKALDRVNLDEFDLRGDLMRIAEAYDSSLRRNIGFVRTMLSQPVIPKLRDQITKDVVEPLRAKFLAYLEQAAARGLVRGLDLSPVIDAFTGMIFAGALRRELGTHPYGRRAYLEACVDVFLNGIAENGPGVRKCK